jgi:hypothetical protein
MVINMFFLNSLTGSILAFFSVLGITIFPFLLKFDYPLSIFVRVNLAFGVLCMFFLHYYRLGNGGKVCSGDYLQEEDFSEANGYLIERGYLMWWYIKAFWISMGLLTAIVVGAVFLTLKSLR